MHGDQPRVTVEVVDEGGQATVRIADNGPGIPEPDLSVLTRERDITQLTHSQGIGLWFVRWVVDALDGQFHLDSTDEGTTIRLQVPRVLTG